VNFVKNTEGPKPDYLHDINHQAGQISYGGKRFLQF